VIGWATVVFGLVLYACDRFGSMGRRFGNLNALSALLIGLAQDLALIPGASRAGVTMSAARILGYDRRDAAGRSPTATGGRDKFTTGGVAIRLWCSAPRREPLLPGGEFLSGETGQYQ
jgi:hypothetical protein